MPIIYSSDKAMTGIYRAIVITPQYPFASVYIPVLHKDQMPFNNTTDLHATDSIIEDIDTGEIIVNGEKLMMRIYDYPQAIMSVPGIGIELHRGDCVWVTFENGDICFPVILGHIGSTLDSYSSAYTNNTSYNNYSISSTIDAFNTNIFEGISSGVVKALTRNEVVDIGWSGDAELIDLTYSPLTSYTIRGSVATSYNHSDYQTRTTNDTAIKRMVAGGTWNWTPRPVILKLKGHLIATSTHTFPHSIPVASSADNIVSPPLTRANQKNEDDTWKIGSHFCLHYIDSITMRTGNPGDGSWTDRMYQAVKDAVTLGNVLFSPQQLRGDSTE